MFYVYAEIGGSSLQVVTDDDDSPRWGGWHVPPGGGPFASEAEAAAEVQRIQSVRRGPSSQELEAASKDAKAAFDALPYATRSAVEAEMAEEHRNNRDRAAASARWVYR